MTQFLILSTIRSLIFQVLFSHLTGSLVSNPFRRRALAAIVALAAAASLDGATPDGWDLEFMFGHPFFFYPFTNSPAVLAVLVVLLLAGRPGQLESSR